MHKWGLNATTSSFVLMPKYTTHNSESPPFALRLQHSYSYSTHSLSLSLASFLPLIFSKFIFPYHQCLWHRQYCCHSFCPFFLSASSSMQTEWCVLFKRRRYSTCKRCRTNTNLVTRLASSRNQVSLISGNAELQ